MGYFKEQKIEQMSFELEVDPFDFLRKQAARAEKAAALRSWWQEEKDELRRNPSDGERSAYISAS